MSSSVDRHWAATNKLTGRSVYAKDKRGVEKVADLSGDLVEKDGLWLLEMKQGAANPATVPFTGPLRLWALPDAKGVLLSGYADPANFNPRHPMPMSFRADAK